MATSPTSGPGGGGGVTPVGAYARLANSLAGFAGGSVTFDTAVFDPASYFDAAGHRFLIPAGKAGLHLVGCQMVATGGVGTTDVYLQIANSGAQANVQAGLAPSPIGNGTWSTTASLLIEAAVGDTLDCSLNFEGVASVIVAGGANGSVFWIVYLG